MLALGPRRHLPARLHARRRRLFGGALAAHPDDNRARRALGMMLRLQPKRVPRARGVAGSRAPGTAGMPGAL